MSDNQRPVAYAGDKPYIFVSYCREDNKRVLPFINALQERYNVWFDEGIPFGEEFEEEIARRIRDCAGFLFMASVQSLESEYCKDELHHARELKKKFIIILMDGDLALPEWFRFRYGRYQICRLFEFSSDARAVAALTEKSKWLKEIAKPEPKVEPLIPAKPVETKDGLPPTPLRLQKSLNKERDTINEKYMITTVGEFEKLADGSYKLLKGSNKLQTVVIPNDVSVIGEEAFYNHEKLERASISNSVITIESCAFFGCHSLRELMISDSVTRIGSSAFSHCTSLRELTIPDSVISVDENTFRCCSKLISVSLGRGLTNISPQMFWLCTELRLIQLPEGVTEIGAHAFEGSGLIEITLPTTLKKVADFAFSECKLHRVNYCGTREQWKKIDFDYSSNHELLDADITYNYTAP